MGLEVEGVRVVAWAPRSAWRRKRRREDAVRLTARRFRRRRRRGRGRLVVLAGVLTLLVLIVVAAAAAVAGRRALARPFLDCDLASLRPLALGQNSFLYAADGAALGAIPSERNRQPVSLGQVSPGCARRPWR